jgi:isopentenyl diphosphate isomerase/L-lactate dehydrogenase-like FMN-dependent dehydrogenase
VALAEDLEIEGIEDVAEHSDRPFWFQLYVMRDRGFIDRLIDRAKASGAASRGRCGRPCGAGRGSGDRG